jgi:hypothetical protein
MFDRYDEERKVGHDLEFSLALLKTYVFGDRFFAPRFRAEVLNVFLACAISPSKDIVGYAGIVKYAYDNIPESRSVQQFLVDKFCYKWSQ